MKKFLIVKIGAIGDVIMALPMLEAIRNENADAKIFWVVGRGSADIVKQFCVDEVIVIDDTKLLGGTIFDKIFSLGKLWWTLFARTFDTIIIGHSDWRYRLITVFTLGRKTKFSKANRRIIPIPGRHFSDEYIRLAVGKDGREMFNYDSAVLYYRSKFLLKRAPKERLVALAPGGAKNILSNDGQRRWPIENYVVLARLLIENGYRVLLTGGASDDWVRTYFRDCPVENYIGKTTVLELATLFSQVDMVVTHDSGPMHIAGLVETDLIALFGPTNPYEKIPKRKNAEFVWLGSIYPCCPCYDGKTYAMCADNICLKRIKPEYVFNQIVQKLVEVEV